MAHKKSKRLEKTDELLLEEHESRETLHTADSLNTVTSVATARSGIESAGSQEIANTKLFDARTARRKRRKKTTRV